jgi:hypothetical protein
MPTGACIAASCAAHAGPPVRAEVVASRGIQPRQQIIEVQSGRKPLLRNMSYCGRASAAVDWLGVEVKMFYLR